MNNILSFLEQSTIYNLLFMPLSAPKKIFMDGLDEKNDYLTFSFINLFFL